MRQPIEIDGDYLIIAPKPGSGNHQMLTERAYLEQNIESFLRRHPEILRDTITIYELKKVEWAYVTRVPANE